jgi:hypothetical protein
MLEWTAKGKWENVAILGPVDAFAHHATRGRQRQKKGVKLFHGEERRPLGAKFEAIIISSKRAWARSFSTHTVVIGESDSLTC